MFGISPKDPLFFAPFHVSEWFPSILMVQTKSSICGHKTNVSNLPSATSRDAAWSPHTAMCLYVWDIY